MIPIQHRSQLCLIYGLFAFCCVFCRTTSADTDSATQAITLEEPFGSPTPEEAASEMLRAMVNRDHDLYLRMRLRSVCEAENEWPNRYAECLHRTRFSHGDKQLTVYEIPFNRSPPIRVVSKTEMDPRVFILLQYPGKQFTIVDLEIDSYDGLKYSARFIVGKTSDRWYAIPRNGESYFYAIADRKISLETYLRTTGYSK